MTPLPRELHIELTERCNAACPMCGRFTSDGLEQTFLANREISIGEFRAHFPPELLRSLFTVRLCGNFGDPAVARDVQPVLEYVRSSAPSLQIVMHTNGASRNERWWYEAGRFFQARGSAVLFAIDGLGDAHSVYRRRTTFEKVFQNASSFIRGGGNAHWVFLVFEHNEHQVEAARELARQTGFFQFTLKRTKRFGGRDGSVSWQREYRDARDGSLLRIRAPRQTRHRNPRLLSLERGTGGEVQAEIPVKCRAHESRSVYISAGGYVFPCCWLGAESASAAESSRTRWLELVENAGGGESLDLRRQTLREILRGEVFATLQRLLAGPSSCRPETCTRICSLDGSAFAEQFEHSRLAPQELFEF